MSTLKSSWRQPILIIDFHKFMGKKDIICNISTKDKSSLLCTNNTSNGPFQTVRQNFCDGRKLGRNSPTLEALFVCNPSNESGIEFFKKLTRNKKFLYSRIEIILHNMLTRVKKPKVKPFGHVILDEFINKREQQISSLVT